MTIIDKRVADALTKLPALQAEKKRETIGVYGDVEYLRDLDEDTYFPLSRRPSEGGDYPADEFATGICAWIAAMRESYNWYEDFVVIFNPRFNILQLSATRTESEIELADRELERSKKIQKFFEDAAEIGGLIK